VTTFGLGAVIFGAMILIPLYYQEIRGFSAVSTGLLGLGPHTSVTSISMVLVTRGIGLGLAAMPAMTAAFRALRPHQVADAGPQLTVLPRIAGSLGTALFAVVLQQHLYRAGGSVELRAQAFGSTFLWVLVTSVIAVVPAVFLCLIERRSGYIAGLVRADTMSEVA
jgi:hypothetical protein